MQEFNVSTKVFFGPGALERLRQVEGKRVLIVTDRFMDQLGVPGRVASRWSRPGWRPSGTAAPRR